MKDYDITDRNFFALFWLEGAGLLDMFMRNHENCERYLERSWESDFYEGLLPTDIIPLSVEAAFHWDGTPEGRVFWDRINSKISTAFNQGVVESGEFFGRPSGQAATYTDFI